MQVDGGPPLLISKSNTCWKDSFGYYHIEPKYRFESEQVHQYNLKVSKEWETEEKMTWVADKIPPQRFPVPLPPDPVKKTPFTARTTSSSTRKASDSLKRRSSSSKVRSCKTSSLNSKSTSLSEHSGNNSEVRLSSQHTRSSGDSLHKKLKASASSRRKKSCGGRHTASSSVSGTQSINNNPLCTSTSHTQSIAKESLRTFSSKTQSVTKESLRTSSSHTQSGTKESLRTSSSHTQSVAMETIGTSCSPIQSVANEFTSTSCSHKQSNMEAGTESTELTSLGEGVNELSAPPLAAVRSSFKTPLLQTPSYPPVNQLQFLPAFAQRTMSRPALIALPPLGEFWCPPMQNHTPAGRRQCKNFVNWL